MLSNETQRFGAEKWLLLGLFSLSAMNLFSGFYLFIYIVLLLHTVFYRSLRVDISIVWYLLFMLVAMAFNMADGVKGAARSGSFIICYAMGYDFMCSIGEREEGELSAQTRWLKAAIFVVAVGAWMHFLLNFLQIEEEITQRNTIDIWTGETMSATGQAALAVMMIAVSVVFIAYPKTKVERVFGIAAFISILLYNLILAGRTIYMLSVIILLVCFFYILFNRNVPGSKKKETFLVMAVLLICIVCMIVFNVANVRTILMESNFVSRFAYAESLGEFMEDARLSIKMNYLKNMLDYPFGGLHMREQFSYAHDLLLDAYDEYGILILVALIGILVDSMISVKRFIRLPEVDPHVKCLIVCLYAALYIEFFIEPILAGMPWLFACFALISGSLRGIVCVRAQDCE